MNDDLARTAAKFLGASILASIVLIAIFAIPGTYVIWNIADAAFTTGNVLQVMKQPLMLFFEFLLLVGIFFAGISVRFILYIMIITGIRYLTL